MKHALRSSSFAALALVAVASGCSLAADYRVPDGTKTQRGYRSVAGAVHVGNGAAINGAMTVAGDITVDDRATTRSLSSVAGDIHIGAGTRVRGQVTSIAGDIHLHGCRIDGLVRLTKGSLDTSGATALPGGILVRHRRSTDEENTPTIDIGPNAEIAAIEVEPDTEVDLRISRDARVGKITGANPTYY